MTWEHVPHVTCQKPWLTGFMPSGSIWRCDTCGKRYRLDKYPGRDGAGTGIVWTPL